MNLQVAAAILSSLLSAAALYAASPHCRWPAWRRRGAYGDVVGLLFAVVSLVVWIDELGGGAGLCAMLGTWMLALMALPYLAWRTAPESATWSNGGPA